MRFGKGTRAMEKRKAADVAAAFYAALAAGDRDQLDALLDPEFTGRTAEGMPFGIGGVHDSPAAMRRNSWGVIARHFEARAEPDRFLDLADVRAVLIAGSGPNFTVGGDLGVFAETAREQLPNRLRRMIDSYHLAIERLTSIDAPVVAAVRGGAGGGGLGLLYAADIVVAADDARFALGYGALGLTADGGNTWFLPRMVGMRQAQQLFLLNRRLTAQEALAFGLVSRLAPSDAVEAEAAALAANLAVGPTRAYGAVRCMLRQSFETGLSEQLDAERETIVVASSTNDAQEGIAAFVAKRRPQFRGE